MATQIAKWSKALLAAFITGSAGALLASLGITGAQVVGVNVSQLNLKQLLIMTATGGIVGAAAYLKQSPVPPDEA